MNVTIRKIGNSLGVILPKAELETIGVGKGDKLFIVHAPNSIRLTPYDPHFAEVMEETRDALRELAK